VANAIGKSKRFSRGDFVRGITRASEAEFRMENGGPEPGTAAEVGSLWEWLQIRGPQTAILLFGVASSDHELLFVIMSNDLPECFQCVNSRFPAMDGTDANSASPFGVLR
jgi:hypothetical protein